MLPSAEYPLTFEASHLLWKDRIIRMDFVFIAIVAIIVDLVIGDPRWIPHPVVGMGKIISWSESYLRN